MSFFGEVLYYLLELLPLPKSCKKKNIWRAALFSSWADRNEIVFEDVLFQILRIKIQFICALFDRARCTKRVKCSLLELCSIGTMVIVNVFLPFC